MIAVLEALRAFWTLIKPIWPYIAGGIVCLSLFLYGRHCYEQELAEAHDRGVAETVAADTAAAEQERKQRDALVTDLKIASAQRETELEGKIHDAQIEADDLRAQLRNVRVCSDDVEVNPGPVAGNPGSASESNGAPGSPRPVETVGGDIVELVKSCKVTTDKLITLEGYAHDVESKLKAAEAAYNAAIKSSATK